MKKIILTTVLFSILFISNSIAHDGDSHEESLKTLKVYTELDFIPFNFYNTDGEFVGIGVDIMNEILKDAKFNHTNPKVIPWARGYKLAQVVPNTALFSIYRTELREDLFYWVGPIATEKMVILTKKENRFDSKDFKVAALRDSASMQMSIKKGIDPKNIMKTNHTNLGLHLLNLNRVDAWAASYGTAVRTIEQEGLDINDYYIYDTLAENDVYFVLSKSTNPEIKDYFSEKIQELKKNGFIKKTLDKYNFHN